MIVSNLSKNSQQALALTSPSEVPREITAIPMDQLRFLSYKRYPAILNAQEVAWLLNCQKDDIPSLVKAGLLTALGTLVESGESPRFGRDLVFRVIGNAEIMTAITRALYSQ